LKEKEMTCLEEKRREGREQKRRCKESNWACFAIVDGKTINSKVIIPRAGQLQ